jgi:hypothetical protein
MDAVGVGHHATKQYVEGRAFNNAINPNNFWYLMKTPVRELKASKRIDSNCVDFGRIFVSLARPVRPPLGHEWPLVRGLPCQPRLS